MNVYDFDGTIYDGDSTADFYCYCLKKKPVLILKAIYHFSAFPLYFTRIKSKTYAKQRFYSFLKSLDNTEELLESFWNKNISKIKDWYYANQKPDDIIISASPEFIVKPACEKIGIKTVMASVVDIKTGKYEGVNCHGKEKVRRFYEAFPDGKINEFYSDSFNDTPLSKEACKAYFVKKNNITDWK